MKIKHLILLTTTAVAASSLSSCKEEPYIITAEEEYTRNFIKEFGLIDPNQDWNLAEGSTVTVKVGNTPAEVKAYMKVDNTYYLMADLQDVAGEVKIPFDMPEGTTDIMVKINGTRYYTSPGGTVDPNNSPRSRAALGGIGEGGLGTSGTYAGVKIDIEKNINKDGTGYLTLNEETMKEVINKKLPEKTQKTTTWTNTNLDVKGVSKDFYANATEFYLFPEYWNTSGTEKNIIGVYWEVEPSTEGAEAVEGRDENGDLKTYYIVRVPFFKNPNLFVTPLQGVLTWFSKFTDFPNWDEIYFPALQKNFPDEYKKDGDKYYHKFRCKADNIWYEIGSVYYNESPNDYENEIGRDLVSLFSDVFVYSSWGPDGGGTAMYTSYTEIQLATDSQTPGEYLRYKSYAVHVKFEKKMRFGFYIEQGDYVMYSETKLNPTLTATNADGEEETRAVSYVATYQEGEDTDGNYKRHLCFEDWAAPDINFDLNDMVFRIYGLDPVKTQNPDKPIETGDIEELDDDDSTPTTPPTVTETEKDTPYSWLLAVEDLGATDDFDFNDIIVGITSVTVQVKGELSQTTNRVIDSDKSSDGLYKKVTFKALAAGGTLPAYVYYGDNIQLYPDGHADRAEWHRWFGDGDLSSGTMINTGRLGIDNQKGASCTLYFGIDSDGKSNFSLEKLGEGAIIGAKNSGLKIGIDKSGQMSYSSDLIDTEYFTEGDDGYFIKPSTPGTAPQMFLIPDEWDGGSRWQWPIERTHIQNSYGRFGNWVNNVSTASDWYTDTGKGVCRPTAK